MMKFRSAYIWVVTTGVMSLFDWKGAVMVFIATLEIFSLEIKIEKLEEILATPHHKRKKMKRTVSKRTK